MRAMFEHLSPAWILLAALVFDAIVGDPYALYRAVPHPVALIGRAIAALDDRWNRPAKGPRLRRLLGVLLLLTIASGSALAGLAVLSRRAPSPTAGSPRRCASMC
jgi:adenosylcobinamide-phosphate synthase